MLEGIGANCVKSIRKLLYAKKKICAIDIDNRIMAQYASFPLFEVEIKDGHVVNRSR